jgi:hypothetical protein
MGGSNDVMMKLRECERYICSEDRWEVLGPLPKGCSILSGATLEMSLYIIGGIERFPRSLDIIQKLTWEVLQVKLPSPDFGLTCFKVGRRPTQIYFIMNKQLYALQPQANQIRQVKAIEKEGIERCKLSYYTQGMLYYFKSTESGRFKIGLLSS